MQCLIIGLWENIGAHYLFRGNESYHTVKNFGKLQSFYIGNVIEIVKIGKKTWQNAVICQIRQSFSLPMFLLYSIYMIFYLMLTDMAPIQNDVLRLSSCLPFMILPVD